MEQAIKEAAGKGNKVNFVRYADDFIVTGATREILEQKVKPALIVFLNQRGLRLSEQKTVTTHIQEGFNFLGHAARKYGDKFLIKPSKSSVQSLLGKVKECIQSGLALRTGELIGRLNPMLRGWANYYQHAAAKRTFNKMDHEVYWMLRRWIKRRHPTKSVKWSKQKYFSATEPKGEFATRIRMADGKDRVLAVHRMARTPVTRYIKVRATANPYAPEYTKDFHMRRSSKARIRRTSSRRTRS